MGGEAEREPSRDRRATEPDYNQQWQRGVGESLAVQV